MKKKPFQTIWNLFWKKECLVNTEWDSFAPDPENDFDDFSVIILDYLYGLKGVIIYSSMQNKIIFSSAKQYWCIIKILFFDGVFLSQFFAMHNTKIP